MPAQEVDISTAAARPTGLVPWRRAASCLETPRRTPYERSRPMAEPETLHERRHRWRTVDIVVASVIAVVFGVVFAIWNNVIYSAIVGPLSGSPAQPLIAGV